MAAIFIIVGIIALVAIFYNVVLIQGRKPRKYTGGKIDWVPEADQWIDTDAIDSHTDMYTNIFIAGLAHHCSIKDCGIFGGIIFNEKDNPVDKKAMAIGSHQSGKIIGYVPKAILEDYREWCCRKKCHCVGFVFRKEGHLQGRVRAYHPDCDLELVEKDGSQYLERVCEIFGWEIPSGDFKI